MTQNLSDNVCFTLYSATNALIRAFRPLLEAYDLTYPQYIVMHSLWYRNQVSLKELSFDTHLDSGTLTPIVKRLEAKGLLTRQVSSEDERKKVISFTHCKIKHVMLNKYQTCNIFYQLAVRVMFNVLFSNRSIHTLTISY